MKRSSFNHTPMERTKTVSFVGSSSRSPFSETSSRPVGTSGSASSLISMASSVRGAGGRLVVTEAGVSVVARGGAVVAEGASASNSN